MDRRLRRLHRSDRFSVLGSAGRGADERRVEVMAEVALRAAAAIRIRQVLRGHGLLSGLQDLGDQAAAIRRRQGRLEREQEQQQDDNGAPESHGAPL